MSYLSNTIKTIEFRIDSEIPQHWLDLLTRVWNESLNILLWHQYYKRYLRYGLSNSIPTAINIKKNGNNYIPSCTIAKEFRKDRSKSWNKENIELRPCCDIVNRDWLSPAPIEKAGAIELRKYFAKKRCEWLQESDIPMVYVNDFIGLTVFKAWEDYLKGNNRKPRFKGKRNKVNSLKSASFRGQVSIKENESLQLPGMRVKVQGLNKRLVEPINKMIGDMQANPQNYPALQIDLPCTQT